MVRMSTGGRPLDEAIREMKARRSLFGNSNSGSRQCSSNGSSCVFSTTGNIQPTGRGSNYGPPCVPQVLSPSQASQQPMTDLQRYSALLRSATGNRTLSECVAERKKARTERLMLHRAMATAPACAAPRALDA